MSLVLTIENTVSLPKGVTSLIEVKRNGQLTIGRYPQSDWVLPDPARFISGRHCAIHHEKGAYWLYDLSTNGTFMNGESRRIEGPKLLKQGDRVAIGIYVLAVSIQPDADLLLPASTRETTRLAVGPAFNNIFRQTVTPDAR